ncbi:TetR/AcrR family transcriptional regulator [Curtobacterium sp. 22159]
MPSTTSRRRRRSVPLSKERLIAATIEILDAEGEDALTFRTLAAHLSTGPGAIYHHVASKAELLMSAASRVISVAIDGSSGEQNPVAALRATAAAVFDAIDAHPWIGAQLTREPWQLAVVQMLEAFGRIFRELGVAKLAQFNTASTLVHYVLGLAGQYAAGARTLGSRTDREAFLLGVTEQWRQLDASTYPFVHSVAEGFEQHDDRKQFLAGVDVILAGALSR